MAEFELKITGSMAELFAIASRLGGATDAPSVIASTPQRVYEDVAVAPVTDTSVAALETGTTAPRKRRAKAEIAADEAAAKPSAFETPVPEEAAPRDAKTGQAEEVVETAPLPTTSPSTSDASPAATLAGEPTYDDCFAMMDLVINKQKPPAGAAAVQKALRDATNGEVASLSVLKERPDMVGAVYMALASFKV